MRANTFIRNFVPIKITRVTLRARKSRVSLQCTHILHAAADSPLAHALDLPRSASFVLREAGEAEVENEIAPAAAAARTENAVKIAKWTKRRGPRERRR